MQESSLYISDPKCTGETCAYICPQYIKGRYIGENIRLIDDVIQYSTIHNTKGHIVLLDFQKAFDSVNIEFLKKALEVFNLGPNFIEWIGIIYNNISSCVTNNGHISEFFPLTRGIRQGCPISAMLFITVVELLATYIRNCADIKGLTINGNVVKITQLADDTTLFLKDQASIKNLICVMDRFYESSGLRLNRQKCEVYLLGNCGLSNNPPDTICGMKCIVDGFKALGIYFSLNKNRVIETNFKQKLEKCKTMMNVWAQYNLTLKGKICILKSKIVPTLLFVCSNLCVPSEFVKEINDLFFSFLWNGKPAKVKWNTIISDIEHGGMSMPHFPTIVKAAKAMWIKRMLSGDDANWKKLALYLACINSFELSCKNDAVYVNSMTSFYEQILSAWFEYQSIKPQTAKEIRDEILWNNRFILIDNKPVWYKKWHKKGIICLRDLLNEEGRLLTREHLNQKFNVNANYLEYLSLVKAIPKEWWLKLKTCNNAPSHHVDFQCKVEMLKSKSIYTTLLERLIKQPSSIEKWISLFPYLHDDDFSELFTIPKTVTETKLQSFQYKILMRIFPCNERLYSWGISTSQLCSLCGKIDTLEHYFFECVNNKTFWSNIESLIEKVFNVHIPLKKADIMFGIPHRKTQDNTLHVLNFIIMYAKWFIYINKKDNKPFSNKGFISYLKSVLEVEHQVHISKNKKQEFHKVWHLFITTITH